MFVSGLAFCVHGYLGRQIALEFRYFFRETHVMYFFKKVCYWFFRLNVCAAVAFLLFNTSRESFEKKVTPRASGAAPRRPSRVRLDEGGNIEP